MRGRRERRDLHGMTAEGRVACNPRDREAAHRAQMQGIATDVLRDVTCRACRELLFRARKRERPP